MLKKTKKGELELLGVSRLRASSPIMRQLIQALDFANVWVAALLAHIFWEGWPSRLPIHYSLLVLIAGILLLVMSSNVYRSWRGGAFVAMLSRVAVSWLGTWALVLIWLVLTRTSDEYSRQWLITWAVLTLGFLWVERFIVYFALRWLRQKGYNHRDVILVGDNLRLEDIRRRVNRSAWTGFRIVDSVGPEDIKQLANRVSLQCADEVWISLPADNIAAVGKILHDLRHSTANIRLVPDLFTYQLMNHGVSVVMGLPMLDLSESPMHGFNLVVKWLEDRLLGITILLMISPVMLAIAIGIKLTSPGPVLFKQRRHGSNGEAIEVWKFRSMVVHKEQDGHVSQASRNDDRITPFGRFLRRTSLDELPQFINVVMGTMSIVGPRPHAIVHNEQYKELIPRYMLRHKVKPGITGWAQVNGLRGETDTVDKMRMRVEYDLYYIEHWSLWKDLKIIFLTLIRGFVNKNAY